MPDFNLVPVDHDPFAGTSFEQRLPDIQGNVEDRRGDQSFTPWSGIKAALADDASFFAEQLGLKQRPHLLPAGDGNSPLAQAAGYDDIGTRPPSPPEYVLKPEDDQRGMLKRAWDAYVDTATNILQPPDSIRWPERERTRPGK